MSSTKAVFFDPDKKRWPRIRLSVVIVISVISLILGLLAFSIISAPVLSSLQLGQAAQIFGKGNHPVRQALLGQYNQRLARTKLALAREIRHSNQIKTLAPRNSSTKTIGYYVNWDPSSLNSLATNINSLDVVIGEWLHLSGSDGSVVIDTSGSYTAALDLIHKRKPDLQVFALINNFENNSWNAKALSTMLASETARQKNITSIIQFVKNNNLTGVNIDFEEVGLESQANLNKYMQELHNACAKENLLVSINLPADDDNFNYKLLSANSDYVILMLYDEHWATGLPGPISSLQWYASIVAKRAPEIGANKLIIGLGNYGYDWAAGQPAVNLTYEEAILSARDSQADISLEPTSLNPYFSYDDEVGVHHDVWFLDATSVYNEIIMAKNIKPFGFSVWRLGSEDPSIWPLLEQDENLNQTSLTPLESIAFGYDVDYQGQGEVLKVVSKPQEGKRSFSYDAQQNLIVNEKYVSFPSPYVIQRYGQANKKIALTFDDGPDPQYTPQILDILKQYNVKASFFIIGQNGDANPELLERIYDEGHDIGNHTYTHPNIAHISLRQLALETSATERLLEATINHQSHLFRSPYAEDSEPDTADQVQPVEFLNNLGYLDVGMQIDPSDWKKPGVDQIVQAVVAGALKNNGNIVLLHDAGGDRSQTIAALPQIITQLQAKGYTFTTVSGLLGKTRDEVMPPVAASSMWKNWANLAGFSFLRYADSVIHYIFLIGIILGLLRILFIIIFAIKQKVTKISKEKFHGTVAVIVAAYNESKVINRTIASLLAAEPKEEASS